METDRITPGQTANETTPAASDRQPGEAPKRDAITRVAFRRGLKLRPILGAGLLVLMVLSAGAYVYSVWDASRDIANRPKSAPIWPARFRRFAAKPGAIDRSKYFRIMPGAIG